MDTREDHRNRWWTVPAALLALAVGLGLFSGAAFAASAAQAEGKASVAASTPIATKQAVSDSPAAPSAACDDTDYAVTAVTGASIVPGTILLAGSQCDDCTVLVNLPFTYNLYGQPFTRAIVGNNGTIGFVDNANLINNTCLPNVAFDYAIVAYWDNLVTMGQPVCADCGIYVSTSGVAPNRIYNIEWRANYFPGVNRAQFEVRLYEGQNRFEIIYGRVDMGGTVATVGVQQGSGGRTTQYECNTSGTISQGLKLTFTQATCTTPTATPTPPTCGPLGNYAVSQTSGAIDPGTSRVTGLGCAECRATIALPFTYNFYGQPFTSVVAGNYGGLGFVDNTNQWNNTCLPSTTVSYAILPYWDDISVSCGTCGIFTSVVGTAPNRVFNIEWRADSNTTGNPVNFEVRLFESGVPGGFEIVYGQVDAGGSSATVGVQKGMGLGGVYTQYSCNTASLSAGLKLVFTQAICPPTATPTGTATSSPTPSNTPTLTYTPTATDTPTPTATDTPTVTYTPTSTFTPSFTLTPSTTATRTFTPSLTPTRTSTLTSTPAQTFTTTATRTNTPSPTITLTSTQSPSVTATATAAMGRALVGHVTWQGAPRQPNPVQEQPVTITLKSGSTEVNYPAQTTDASGYFTVSLGTLPVGTYDWRVKGARQLANAGTVTLFPLSGAQIECGLLVAGDANNDNVVDALDFNLLKNSFGRTPGDPAFDSRADFNIDNLVDSIDFNLLKNSFGAVGAREL